MRVGDFGVEVIACGGGRVRELESGHVLARPGQAYRLRLRNCGPLYCVVHVDIDGRRVTAGGLVLEPWGVTELERPIDLGEDGCFTVAPEGDESVFGPDGGRDNAALGLVEASFRRELPGHDHRAEMPPAVSLPSMPPSVRPVPGIPLLPRRFPAPPEWAPPLNRMPSPFDRRSSGTSAYHTAVPPAAPVARDDASAIERAAGTGLTGHSDQRFVPIALGPLEAEATTIRLRIVIGTEAALAAESSRPLAEHVAPARPAARP